jgi:FkbM family methyltransferase
MSGMKHLLGKALNKVLNPIGLALEKHPAQLSLEGAFQRIGSLGLEIGTVIDVGASDGHWSKKAMGAFPAAKYFLVEANAYHKARLEDFCARHPGCQYILAAAGDKEGEIFFDGSDPFGGLASHSPTTPTDIRVPVTTIDNQIAEHSLRGPYCIKLDTHGFEVPILEGARSALERSELVIIEVYNFHATDSALLFYEMCAYMDAKGFRPADFCDPIHRSRDAVLWQFDIFFLRKTHPAFASRSFGA